MTSPNQHPVAIGGLGGSGTRLIATIVDRLGYFIGDNLNSSLDNLYFTLLFNRPLWFHRFPSDGEISVAISLFARAMTTGLSSNVSQQEMAAIRRIGAQVDDAGLPIGIDGSQAQKILESRAPETSGCIGWGWKEPNTHIFLPQLAAGIEQLKYIHVIRNGLDMAFSQNQNQLRKWNLLIRGRAFDPESGVPAQSLDYWIAANRRAVAEGEKQLPGRFLLLNYDDLCASPREGIGELADFLDVDLPSEKLDSLVSLVAPISTGRWKKHGTAMFSDEQLAAVRALGFDLAPG